MRLFYNRIDNVTKKAGTAAKIGRNLALSTIAFFSVAASPIAQRDLSQPSVAAHSHLKSSRARQPSCGPGRYETTSEVCAAWKSADAAETAAQYSFWGLLLSGVGTVLLLWTLWETRETSRREHRAYLRVETIGEGSVQPERKIQLPLHVINYGLTPAVECCVQSSVVVRPPDWSWSKEPNDVDQFADGRTAITIHPGTPFLIKLTMDDALPEEVHSQIMQGRAVVYAKGRIEYRDVFRRKRHTSFQFEFHGSDAGPRGFGGHVRIAATGNDFS